MDEAERAFLRQTGVLIPSVNRVLALYVVLLAGFWGGHKFLLGARREGWLYLALSWTAVPLLASLVDAVELHRQPALGRGFGCRRLSARHPADANVIVRSTWRRLVMGAVVWVVLALGAAAWRA